MRVGYGFDAHRLELGKRLVLGGVEIPHAQGLIGHSDADVVIHAVCDALLGAAGLGDIGQYYPSSKEELAGIDSRIILRQIIEMLNYQNFKILNVDITIVAEEPKLDPFRDQMRIHLAEDLHIKRDQTNIKAKTTEGMGYTGRQEGIAAHAVVLIQKVDTPPKPQVEL